MIYKKNNIVITIIIFVFITTTQLISLKANDVINGDVFKINLNSQIDTLKKSGNLIILITPSTGNHCNTEYPVKIFFNKPSNISISKTVFGKSDAQIFNKTKIKYAIPFKLLNKNGKLSGNIKFSICSNTQCFMKKIPFKYLI